MLQVMGGVATFTDANKIFLGATSGEKVPPTGLRYGTFRFAPKLEESGHLIFQSSSTPHFRYYFHYQWAKNDTEKLEVSLGIKSDRIWSESDECGLMVDGGNYTFVLRLPKDLGDQKYRVVDEVAMLHYLEGKIGLKDLSRAAGRIVLATIREKRMRDHEIMLRLCQEFLDTKDRTIDALRERAASTKVVDDVFRKNVDTMTALLSSVRQQLRNTYFSLNEISLTIANMRWLYKKVLVWLFPTIARDINTQLRNIRRTAAQYGEKLD